MYEGMLDRRGKEKIFNNNKKIREKLQISKGYSSSEAKSSKSAALPCTCISPLSPQDNDNVTPLHAAVYNGRRSAVKLLIASNADLNQETKFGNTALHMACMEKWLVIGKSSMA